MQNWLPEKLVETQRADFRREIVGLNLISEAEHAYDARQGWPKKLMHNMGVWMMNVGERLHNRNHTPAPLPRWYQGSTLAR